MIWTDFFNVPFLRTLNRFSSGLTSGSDQTLETSDSGYSSLVTNLTEISFSDHEAVTSHLLLWKYSPPSFEKLFKFITRS